MEHYVARYVVLADHAWYALRAAGMPGWLLVHADLGVRQDRHHARDAPVVDQRPEGGVHVFAHGDPLADDR